MDLLTFILALKKAKKYTDDNFVLKSDVVQTVTPSQNYDNENPISSKAVHTAIRGSAYLASGGKNGTVTANERAKVQALPTRETVTEYASGLILTKNKSLNIGILDKNLNLVLPDGLYGDVAQLDFCTGDTAYDVTINEGPQIPHTAFSLTTAANTAYSILFAFGPIRAGSNAVVNGWRIETKSYSNPT